MITSSLFIGRRTELEYFQMVLAQSSFSQNIGGGFARIFKSRVFLPFGIGGIGKTELAKQCLRLAQDAGWSTLMIDWDRTDCRPVEPQDLMNTIANSIRDLAGEKAIAPYLNDFKRAAPVQDKVHRYRAEHPDEWQKLINFAQAATTAMPDLQTKVIVAAATTTLNMGPQVLAKAYDLLVDQMIERKALKDANEALLFRNANSLLARHLVQSIIDIAVANHLVLLLDTGEVLSLALEEFLRDLIVCPAVGHGSGLIFIISGRYDQYRERQIEDSGGNLKRVKGYADQLTDPPPVTWSLSLFTDPEVADYLRAAGIKTSPDLITYVQEVTRGVPAALQLLTEAIFKLGPDRIRKDFPPKDPTEFDTSEMVILVVRRFLRYCIDKPSDEYRLRALAFLRKRDDAALRAIWELTAEERPRDILTDLEARYGFIQPGGALHDVVRQFLRESMRIDDRDTAQHLSQLAINYFSRLWEDETANLTSLIQRFNDNRWLDLTRDFLNSLCWNHNERIALRFLVARVIEAHLFNSSVAKGFLDQVDEFKNAPNWWGDNSKRHIQNLVQMIGLNQKEALSGLSALFQDAALLGLSDMHQTILHIFRANNLLAQGKRDEAFAACQSAHSPSLTDESLRHRLAQMYIEVGQELDSHDQAKLSLDCDSRAIELSPKYYLPYLRRGRTYAHVIRDYASAFADFAKAIEIQPEEPLSRICRGCVYRSLHNYSDAINDQTKAIELAPFESYSYENRGKTYIEEENFPAAISDFTKAIELKPTDSDNYFNRGSIYYTLEDYSGALADFTKAIELKPEDSNPYLLRGQAYDALKDYPAALADFSKAIELKPEDGDNYHLRAHTHQSQNDISTAITDFTNAITLNPTISSHYHCRGQCYTLLKDHAAALADFSKAVELDPGKSLYYSARGAVYVTLNDYSRALSDYSKAIELKSEDSGNYYNRGGIYYVINDYPLALADFSKAVSLQPGESAYYYARGLIYSILKDFPSALTNFCKSIELKPEDGDNYLNRGDVYYELKDYPAALADFTKSIELEPEKSSQPQNHLFLNWLYLSSPVLLLA